MPASDPGELAARLRDRDLSVAPAVLNLVENRAPAGREAVAELLHAVSPATLGAEAPAHLVGVTGPPGAGKSSLLSELVRAWRARDRSVAVLAVDPSSRRSGGALLGDRARIASDPGDRSVFVRSTAAGERLGGLAPATRAAAQALAAAFDLVVIETVGVGQSETEVADVADTVAVVVQPGSGDVLQFLKAGIMEIPDLLVVTKADIGTVADRARRDLHAALRALGSRRPRRLRSPLPATDRDRGARRGAGRAPRADGCRRAPRARPAPLRRLRTSPPSTESEGCAPSAAAARPRSGSRETNPGLDVPALTRALEERALEAS